MDIQNRTMNRLNNLFNEVLFTSFFGFFFFMRSIVHRKALRF